MAVDKLIDSTQLDSAMAATANAIRAKTGNAGTIAWDMTAGFKAAIDTIETDCYPAVSNHSYSEDNQAIEEFASEVNYTSDYSSSSVSEYVDKAYANLGRPQGQTVSNSGTLYLYDIAGGGFDVQSVSASSRIYNVMPNGIAAYEVVSDGKIIEGGRLTPTGNVRIIFGETLKNIRDLGGWSCDGGTVRYGLLFRGSELDGYNSGNPASAADIQMLENLLNIDAELDMRDLAEGGGAQTFDSYLWQPTESYASIFSSAESKAQFKAAAEFVMNKAVAREPVFFHCAAGADRAGTLAWLLLALLGVSQSDCDKEYEITSFSGPTRSRSTYLGGLYNAVTALGGDTFFDSILWAFKTIGIDIALVNQFRHAMIVGTASDVEYSSFVPIEISVADLKCSTRTKQTAYSDTGTWSTSMLESDNGIFACMATTPNDYAYTDREDNTVYMMPVPEACSKVYVSTSDTSVIDWEFIGFVMNGAQYSKAFKVSGVGSSYDFSSTGITHIAINGIYSRNGSVKTPWNYDSSLITIIFANF